MTMVRRSLTAALAVLLTAQLVLATPQPAPPYPPSPPPPRSDEIPAPVPAPVYRGPARAVDATPPPLSPTMRVIYAPFYVTGLVLRYGLYYLFVAPFEVLGRTATYGVEGGVPRPQPEPEGNGQ
jgi:hypothetical protein